jgi:hypothetical protein
LSPLLTCQTPRKPWYGNNIFFALLCKIMVSQWVHTAWSAILLSFREKILELLIFPIANTLCCTNEIYVQSLRMNKDPSTCQALVQSQHSQTTKWKRFFTENNKTVSSNYTHCHPSPFPQFLPLYKLYTNATDS